MFTRLAPDPTHLLADTQVQRAIFILYIPVNLHRCHSTTVSAEAEKVSAEAEKGKLLSEWILVQSLDKRKRRKPMLSRFHQVLSRIVHAVLETTYLYNNLIIGGLEISQNASCFCQTEFS